MIVINNIFSCSIIQSHEPRGSKTALSKLDEKDSDRERKSMPCAPHSPLSPSMFVDAKTNSSKESKVSDSSRSLLDIKATKNDTLKLDEFLSGKSTLAHRFVGLALTAVGRILVSDGWHRKVSVFTKQPVFGLVSSITVRETPIDIAAINDTEVAVSTYKKCLVILDITRPKIKIKERVQLPFEIYGITCHQDKLIVTNIFNPYTVKLIDKSGKVFWSASHDQLGQHLFSNPNSVSSHSNGVVVSDDRTKTLTLLDANTGNIITRRHLTEEPYGITTDAEGNVYVCYKMRREIAVFNSDLSQEKTVLKGKDGLSYHPLTVAFDNSTRELFVGYEFLSICDCFELF